MRLTKWSADAYNDWLMLLLRASMGFVIIYRLAWKHDPPSFALALLIVVVYWPWQHWAVWWVHYVKKRLEAKLPPEKVA